MLLQSGDIISSMGAYVRKNICKILGYALYFSVMHWVAISTQECHQMGAPVPHSTHCKL